MSAPVTGAAPAGEVRRGAEFRYESYEIDPAAGLLSCRYSVDGRQFEERITLSPAGRWDHPAVDAAARLVFLLAGVSYYKTAAPPVIQMGGQPFVLAVPVASGVASVRELVELARKNPGRLNYSSLGNGSGTHITMELLKREAGVDLVHVPYAGGPAAAAAVATGEVQALGVESEAHALVDFQAGGGIKARHHGGGSGADVEQDLVAERLDHLDRRIERVLRCIGPGRDTQGLRPHAQGDAPARVAS